MRQCVFALSFFALFHYACLTSLPTSPKPFQNVFYSDPRIDVPRTTLDLLKTLTDWSSQEGLKGRSWADRCKMIAENGRRRMDEMSESNVDTQITWRNRTTETVLFSNRTAGSRAVKFARRVIAGDFGLAEMQEVLERCRFHPPHKFMQDPPAKPFIK